MGRIGRDRRDYEQSSGGHNLGQRLFELRCHLVHDRRSRCPRPFVGGASLGEVLALRSCLLVHHGGVVQRSLRPPRRRHSGLLSRSSTPQGSAAARPGHAGIGSGGGADHRGLGRGLGMAAGAVGLHKSEHQIGASPEQSRAGGSVPLHQLGLGSLRRLPADPARHRGFVLPHVHPPSPYEQLVAVRRDRRWVAAGRARLPPILRGDSGFWRCPCSRACCGRRPI